jgi:hypothetical protein
MKTLKQFVGESLDKQKSAVKWARRVAGPGKSEHNGRGAWIMDHDKGHEPGETDWGTPVKSIHDSVHKAVKTGMKTGDVVRHYEENHPRHGRTHHVILSKAHGYYRHVQLHAHGGAVVMHPNDED